MTFQNDNNQLNNPLNNTLNNPLNNNQRELEEIQEAMEQGYNWLRFGIFIVVFIVFFVFFAKGCIDMSFADDYKNNIQLQNEYQNTQSKRILIIQHQTLQTYRDVFFGYVNSLPENQYKITRFNADNDLNLLNSFVKNITIQKNYDLILAIGTLSAQKILSLEKEKPVLITGLSSPEYSGLIKKWSGSGENWSGAEVRNQTYNGLKFLHNIIKFKNIGIIYIENDPSHEGSVKELRAIGRELKALVFAKGIKNRDKNNKKFSNDVMKKIITSALNQVVPYTDTFFINLSKTFIDNYKVFDEMFVKNKILSIGDKAYIGYGLVIGISSDYFKRGELCAYYTQLVLEQGKDIGQLPINMIPKFGIEYDLNAAQKIEFNPSAQFLLNVTGIQTKLE